MTVSTWLDQTAHFITNLSSSARYCDKQSGVAGEYHADMWNVVGDTRRPKAGCDSADTLDEQSSNSRGDSLRQRDVGNKTHHHFDRSLHRAIEVTIITWGLPADYVLRW